MRLMKMLAAVLLLVLLASPSLAAEKEDLVHYLLLGVDEWGETEEGSARSDAIVLISLDEKGNRVVLTSFARDSLVKPSYRKGYVKLNTLVRSSHGEHMLLEYIEDVMEIDVKGYFVVSLSGATDVVDAFGGVDIELTEEEAYYLRSRVEEKEGYPLHQGLCRLDGEQAVSYMRCRSLDNDFGRQRRQVNVLKAMLDEIASLSMLEMVGLIDEVMQMFRSDLTGTELMEFVRRALPLRDAQIITHSLPEPGTYSYGSDQNGASGVRFDVEECRAKLYEVLELELDPSAATDEEKEAE